MKRALFLCGKARMRSPTAADLAERLWGIEADFAGLSNDADEKLALDQVEWADVIFTMEKRQVKRLKTLFGPSLRGRKLACLDVPDRYRFMDDALIEVLTARLSAHFGVPR